MCSLLVSAAVASGLLASAARACDPVPAGCLPRVVVFPAYTHEGRRIGTVAATVHRPATLELSPYTGQPITVLYNDPGRLPGSVDPVMALVRLPTVGRFNTKGAYPRGY